MRDNPQARFLGELGRGNTPGGYPANSAHTSGVSHLEFQALRYAAMVSTMTFDDLVGHYEHYLAAVEPEAVGEAQARLVGWLDDGDSTIISRSVRIVLVSAGFDREVTKTVLWSTDTEQVLERLTRLAPEQSAIGH